MGYKLREVRSEEMRVLVGCEESQAVCKAFRELGHEAFSCDICLVVEVILNGIFKEMF